MWNQEKAQNIWNIKVMITSDLQMFFFNPINFATAFKIFNYSHSGCFLFISNIWDNYIFPLIIDQ